MGIFLWDCNVRRQRLTFQNYLAMNTLLQVSDKNVVFSSQFIQMKVIASFSLFGFQFFFFFFCLLFLFWRSITINLGLNIFLESDRKGRCLLNLNTGPTTMIIIVHLYSGISTICSWRLFFIIRSIYKSIKV